MVDRGVSGALKELCDGPAQVIGRLCKVSRHQIRTKAALLQAIDPDAVRGHVAELRPGAPSVAVRGAWQADELTKPLNLLVSAMGLEPMTL